jgi:DNA-binding PadR family transcriptional regulator
VVYAPLVPVRLAVSENVILTLLAANGPSYGLQLVGASRGRLKRGGIYVTLGRMEDKGHVTSKEADGGRRLYRPTALGERSLLAAVRRQVSVDHPVV